MCLIRRVGVCSILLAFGALFAYSQTLPPSSGDPADIAQLLKLEEERHLAQVSVSPKDLARLGDLLAEDYTHTHSSGGTMNKKEYMASRSPQKSSSKMNVRVYGNVAVMSGTQYQMDSSPTREQGLTLVWIRSGNTWKVNTYQSTWRAAPTTRR